jgi:hypothetical protein
MRVSSKIYLAGKISGFAARSRTLASRRRSAYGENEIIIHAVRHAAREPSSMPGSGEPS